ncbi:IS66 family insertion sequence element accessory protein TnpB [Acidithiobacillus sp. AMEEHan]|uniref:IS66 family insertion sequence element accessory protein TnpB n=1 Tax=Acidithiobacillus sp. AMEEHan TaxID=2994951 RepID=UPI0027E4026F|nr:IS66 family insertion sequence element accessory protein TnpB [Acidithiobacillus sp. AMEEHan]
MWVGPERTVFVIQEPVDMRKSIDGLAALVLESWGNAPLRTAVFVGFNKGRDKVRLLWWDRQVCPGAKDYGVAKSRKIPPKYEGQLQHSLAVSRSDLLVYASYRPEVDPKPILIEVKPAPVYQDRLFRMEEAFWKAVQERDWSLFDSVATGSLPEGFAEIAAEYREVAQLLSEVSDRENLEKGTLVYFGWRGLTRCLRSGSHPIQSSWL